MCVYIYIYIYMFTDCSTQGSNGLFPMCKALPDFQKRRPIGAEFEGTAS